MKSPTTNIIALFAMIMGTATAIYIFAASRNDPGLRIAALTLGSSSIGSLLAIASTLLTGKDLTNRQPDLPPGTTQVTQTPPANTAVTVAPKPDNQEHP